jgi:hypothetical protein
MRCLDLIERAPAIASGFLIYRIRFYRFVIGAKKEDWMNLTLRLCVALALAGIALGQTKSKDVDGWESRQIGRSDPDE